MIEKVNPNHPDKIADRISGAIVDLAYTKERRPRISVEVLIGQGVCNIIITSDIKFKRKEICDIVYRIYNSKIKINLKVARQDVHLALNQIGEIRCGDNGIFKGVPLTEEERYLSQISKKLYNTYKSDGKYIYNESSNDLIICQSNAKDDDVKNLLQTNKNLIINPLGYWTGGCDVDSGATNRKVGSDLGNSVTGGGINGKDLSKCDVSANIYCFALAQKLNKVIKAYCNIGSDYITIYECTPIIEKIISSNTVSYNEVVKFANSYIKKIGGFEKLAEWGLF